MTIARHYPYCTPTTQMTFIAIHVIGKTNQTSLTKTTQIAALP